MYFAHERHPECPWLELASLRRPGDLHKSIKERFGSGVSPADGARRVADIILGQSDGSVTRAAENLEGLLNTLSSHWVRFGPMYNAAKHGFAVGAEEDHVKMSAEQLTMETAGPAIQYLDYKKSDGRWMEATTFVDSPRSLALTGLAVLTLRSLWTVARSRYTDDDSPVETFQMQKPITEVFGDSTPSESSIRTVRSILQTINEEKAGEGGYGSWKSTSTVRSLDLRTPRRVRTPSKIAFSCDIGDDPERNPFRAGDLRNVGPHRLMPRC